MQQPVVEGDEDTQGPVFDVGRHKAAVTAVDHMGNGAQRQVPPIAADTANLDLVAVHGLIGLTRRDEERPLGSLHRGGVAHIDTQRPHEKGTLLGSRGSMPSPTPI